MRFAIAVVLIPGTAFAASAFEQAFPGQWTATAVTPGGNVSETLTVVKTADGHDIKAKLVEPVPEGTPQAGAGTDIVLDGNKFSYERTLMTPDGSLGITYTGVVSGDTFSGTVNLGGFAEAPDNGVRIPRQDQGERLEHGQ
jgi:hypothetical protein